MPAEDSMRQVRHDRLSFSAAVAASAVLLMGLVNMLSALVGIDPARLKVLGQVLPLEVHQGSRTLAALAGLMLCILSWALWRRKHQGFVAAVTVLALSTLLHLFKGLDFEEAGLAACVLALLLWRRRVFSVRSDPWRFARALNATAWIVLGGLSYGVAGFYLLQRHFTPAFDLGSALQSTVALMTQLGGPALVPVRPSHEAVWFEDSLVAMGLGSAVFIALTLLRPLPGAVAAAQRERRELARLLRSTGAPPLAYLALMPGMSCFFSGDRRAAIAYRVAGGVAVALGDPLGAEERIPQAVAAFYAHCFECDWQVAWYQITPRWLPDLLERGNQAVKIGEDALIDLGGLEFKGKDWQDVRTARSRLPREGYRAEWYDITHDPWLWLPVLDEISHGWLKEQGGEERGFSLGTWPLAQRYAHEQRFLVLVGPEGKPAAFMSFLPVYWAGGGWMLDLMRKRPGLTPGAMEFLLGEAILKFQEEGAAVLSLGLSPLASEKPDELETTPELLEKVRGLLFENYNRFYNFKGLHRFKAKFLPRWEPRYLVFASLAGLPAVIAALFTLHRTRTRALPAPGDVQRAMEEE